MANNTPKISIRKMVCPTVPGLTDYEQDLLRRLFKTWSENLDKNRIKRKYYRAHEGLKDLGISIPPNCKNIEACIGWAGLAVDMLATRSRFDGFVYAGEPETTLDDVLTDNKFKMLYTQACTSELVGATAFLTVSAGGEGEPQVLINAYSVETAAGVWDSRLKCLEGGFTIIDVNEKTGQPKWINLYTRDFVIEIVDDGGWKIKDGEGRHPNSHGRPLMEALVYRPDLDNPFGRSRISRYVRSICDKAIRSTVRAEIGAEFYTSPQKYLLGFSPELVDAEEGTIAGKTKWETYVGSILAISRDDDGYTPQFGQLSQGTMQPHSDYLRSLASQFSAETKIPVGCLGVQTDNPTSAEAIRASENYLIIEAEQLNETNGEALRNIGLLATAIKKGCAVSELSKEELSLTAKFKNPAFPSAVSQSDALIKQVSCMPWLADTDVILEELGYSDAQITRLKAEKSRIAAQSAIAAIQAGQAEQGAAMLVAAGTMETGND